MVRTYQESLPFVTHFVLQGLRVSRRWQRGPGPVDEGSSIYVTPAWAARLSSVAEV